MKILLIGASGFIGSHILSEALRRSHEVTALVRQAGSLPANSQNQTITGDASSAEDVARAAKGHNVVISSISARKPGDTAIDLMQQSVVRGIRQTGENVRLFVVGGVGSLEVAPGLQVKDVPGTPDTYKEEARQQGEVLKFLRGLSDLNWTYLSPAAEIISGERTEKFRLGGDQFLTDDSGRSFISVQDYAVAVLNELEQPKFERKRFSIAY